MALREKYKSQPELWNIYLDIMIDEGRYNKVHWPLDGMQEPDAFAEIERKNNDQTNSWKNQTRCALRQFEGMFLKNNRCSDSPELGSGCQPQKDLDEEDKWAILFFAKYLRAKLLKINTTASFEALDDLAVFVIGQVPFLSPDNDLKFEILFYLEAAACHRDDISLGCSEKVLKAIEKTYPKDDEIKERNPYELVALYSKALTLAHKPGMEDKQAAYDTFYQITDILAKPEEIKKYDEDLGRISSGNGRNLWYLYIFIPALLGQVEVLNDLQRSYDSRKTLKTVEMELNKLRNEVPVANHQVCVTYHRIRLEMLQIRDELDKGSLRDLKSREEAEKKYNELIEKLNNIDESIQKIMLEKPNGLNTAHQALSVQVKREYLKSVLALEQTLKDTLLNVLKECACDFKGSKNEIEKADRLMDWLETFGLVVEYINNPNRKPAEFSMDKDNYPELRWKNADEGDDYWRPDELEASRYDPNDKSFINQLSFLAQLDNNINECKSNHWIPNQDVEVTGMDLIESLNNTKPNRMHMIFGKNYPSLKLDLIHLECSLINNKLKDMEWQGTKTSSKWEVVRLVRRLQILEYQVQRLQDDTNVKKAEKPKQDGEGGNNTIITGAKNLKKEIRNLIIKNENGLLQDNCRYSLNLAKGGNGFSQFIKTTAEDWNLRAMYRNTEQFDGRLIFHSRCRNLHDVYAMTMLRRWQSYTPSLSGGTLHSLGGGYFVYKTDMAGVIQDGLVIDPGFDFVENFFGAGFSIRDITGIVLTHDHPDHTNDFRTLLMLVNEMNKRGRQRFGPDWKEGKITIIASAGAVYKYYDDLKTNRDNINDTIVARFSEDICQKIFEHFDVKFTPAFHKDLSKLDGIGIIISSSDGSELVGFTGDTVWVEGLAKYYGGCRCLCMNMGGIIDVRKNQSFRNLREEKLIDFMYEQNHMYIPGFLLFLEELSKPNARPDLIVISELGEELKGGIREELAANAEIVISELDRLKKVKPNPIKVLAEDIGLTIDLSNSKVQCSKCKGFINFGDIKQMTRMLDRDGEELLYLCNECFECYTRLTRSEQRDF